VTDFNPETPNNSLPDLPPPIEMIESAEIR
jgi:hypothetical protein